MQFLPWQITGRIQKVLLFNLKGHQQNSTGTLGTENQIGAKGWFEREKKPREAHFNI